MPNKEKLLDGMDVVRSNVIRRNQEGASGIAHLTNREDSISKRRRERFALADAVSNVGRKNQAAAVSKFEKREREVRKEQTKEAIRRAEIDAERALDLVEQLERELVELNTPRTDEAVQNTKRKTRAVGSK